MLYDPKWEVKTDVFSLGNLVAWLEMKPRRERYDFMNCGGECLYGQYMAAHGMTMFEGGAGPACYSTPQREAFCARVYDDVACSKPWTFGAALARARAALNAEERHTPKEN